MGTRSTCGAYTYIVYTGKMIIYTNIKYMCVCTLTHREEKEEGKEGRREGEGEQFQRSLSELHWPLYFLACSKGSGPYDEEQMESKLLIWGSLELKETKKKKTDVSYLLHGAMPKGWRIPD